MSGRAKPKRRGKLDKGEVLELVRALSCWSVDRYNYGACADSVSTRLEMARDEVLRLLEQELS